MAIVDAAQLNRITGSLRQSYTGTTALTKDAFVANLIIFRTSAQFLRGDFLKLLPGGHGDRM